MALRSGPQKSMAVCECVFVLAFSQKHGLRDFRLFFCFDLTLSAANVDVSGALHVAWPSSP